VTGWLAVSHGEHVRRSRKSHTHVLSVTLSNTLLPILMNATLRLRELFDLDCDPASIATHLASDPLLAPEVKAAPGLRMPARGSL
jgi:3-methyladenine DNA glycosylase/8-oxoguanine DNA glycosylase